MLGSFSAFFVPNDFYTTIKRDSYNDISFNDILRWQQIEMSHWPTELLQDATGTTFVGSMGQTTING